MLTKKDILIIVLILIILLGGGLFLHQKYVGPYYQRQGVSAVILNINQQRAIPVLNEQGEANWIPIQQICQELK